MAEEEKKVPMTITPAKVEQRSVAKDLAKYAMDEYIKPKTNDVLHDLFAGVIDMFGDAIRGAIDKQFYGEDRSRNRIRNNNNVKTFNQNVNYNVYSLSPSSSYQRQIRPDNSHRSGKSIKTVYVNTKDQAYAVINELKKEIETYGNVKVGKFYEQFTSDDGGNSIPTTPEDWKFGWTDPRDFGIEQDRKTGLWTFNFAEPINVLNN